MNTQNTNHYSKAKRLLSILLCLVLLFSMSGGAAEAFVVPAQAAAAGVAAAAGRGVSGLQSFASSLSGRFGGAFTRFSVWMLSILPDPDTGSHSLTDVYWNINPNTVELETVIIYGGNDDNSGADDAHPVLTWEKALSLAAPGATVWVMDQESFTADETRSGAVPGGSVTLRFHDNNTSMFSVAENAALTLENIGLIDENNPDPTVERRLALLQNSALRLGGNVSAKGLLVVEELLPVETPLVTVTEVPGADFINNVALQFRFDIDDPTYHDGDLNAASYLTRDGARDVVELAAFPEGFDASSLINNETGPNAVTLHPSLTDETALLYVWKLRTKLGAPNVIEAYLAEKYDGAIYLSGLGDDANRGLYPDEPVRTYARALAILTGEDAVANTYRAEHGSYAPGHGVIRIVGAPVEVADGEAWAMPTDTSWVNTSSNTVSPSWVERYKYYSGALVSVGSGVHFTLNGVTVKGNKAEVPNAVGSVIEIAAGGSVTLNTGALLTENHAENGGGVYVNGGAQLTLSGGSITKCAATNGGGVYVKTGTVNVNSGDIGSNSATNGGGIYSRTAYVEMTGGEIKSNSAANGAGVYVTRDEADETDVTPFFLFSGGAIKGNSATASGGGLYLCADPAVEGAPARTIVKLTAHGEGEGILNNTAERGGGIYSKEDITILPADAPNAAIEAAEGYVSTAAVTGNIAYRYGGGWYMDGNGKDDGINMTLNGGEIAGNAVNTNPYTSSNFSAVGGGGVCIVKGRLTLTNGAGIHDNEILGRHHYYYLRGAGVYMTDPLGFHLGAGSEISRNSMRLSANDNYDYMYGGGVYLLGNDTLAANGDPADFTVEGEICGNTLTNGGRYNYVQPVYGCGMYVVNVPLTVSGGKFNNNRGKINYGRAYGIGLYHSGSRLIVNSNAEFNDNTIEVTNSTINSSYVYGHVYGGGLNKYEGTVTIEDASFLRNTAVYPSSSYPAPRQGGGAYLDSIPSAAITDTLFEENGAGYTSGGALCVSTTKLNYSSPTYMNGTVTVTDTDFVNNSAFADGAAYVEVTRQTTFTGCTFTGNRATSTESGALTLMDRNLLENMNAAIDGCVFQNNTAATNAGAMLLGGTSTTYALNVTVANSTFGGDTAEQGNRALLAASDSSTGSCGGAINNRCAKLTLGGGNVIKNNTAVNGGGIYNNSTALTISTAEGETPTVITANTAANGAGIYNNTARLTVNAADLTGNVTGDDVKGPAVYNNTGTVYLNAAASDADGIYLNARLHPVLLTGAPAADWRCEMDLNVSDGSNKFVAGDSVVEPASPLTDAAPYENNFILIRDAAAAYDMVAVATNLVLAPRAVYIDGVDGDDLNSGSKPTQAVKTFTRASALLSDLLNANPTAEKKIYIVNTVTVTGTELWSFDGDTMPAVDDEGALTGEMIPITGVVMQAYIADNRLKAADKALVLVDGGDLTFDSMTLDGNRASFPNQCANFGFKALHNGKLTILGDASGEDPETDVYAAVQNHYAAIYAAGTAADENDRPALRIDDTLIKDCNSTGTIYTNNTGYSAGVTMQYGTLTMDNVDISNCITRTFGGGLYMNNVTAELNAVKVRNSRVNTSAGKYGSYTDGFSAYNGSGGGVYAADSTVTMTGCEVSGCGKGAQGNSSGSGVSVLRGTFNAFDCLFTNNGYVATGNSYVAENSASGGAVWVCGDVTADFTRCAFTKNSAYCGGALCLEIASGAAPTVTVSGCTFGGTDTADKNTSYQAGAAIFSHGNGDVRPTLSLGSYTDPETGEVTRTLIQNNLTGFIPYHGAVYLSFTDFTAENTDFADNQINPPNSTVSSRHGANSAFHPGGAAVYSYSGTAAYKNCTFTNNAVMKVVLQNGNNALPVGGAVFTQGSCAVTVEGCSFTGNYMTNYESNSSVSQMQGSAICVRGGSLTARNSLFKNNKITVTQGDGGAILNDIRVQGTLAIESGALVVDGCEFDGNQLITPNRSRFYTRGSAIHTYACDVTIKDLVSKNGSSVFGVAVALGSNTRNSFEGNIDITDGDIALSGSTPISLAGPLTGTGDIKLRYDETFLGKHIVCGYADGYHNEAPAAGQTLDADIYLASDAAARFVPAALPEYQHLGLAAGTGEYDLDIIVKNETDVYLDGHNGLDAVIDGDTLIYQTDASGVVHDGTAPDKAFKTFACAKKALESTVGGGNIVVCGQVTVTGEETWSLEEMTVNGETWTPRLVRFMDPYKSADGNKRDATDTELKTRYTGYLIDIPAGGKLTLENIEVSGMFAACERPRPCSSLIRVSGGDLTLGQGSHLTDNDASSTGGAVRVDSGYAEMTDDALIDFCWVDTNYGSYFMDSGHGYGGAVAVFGGEFRMTGENSKITDCGSTYVMDYMRDCYGALVYVSGGKFRQYAGTLANARVWCKGKFWDGQEWTANYFYQGYFYGAVYANGARYNAETDTGSLIEIGGTIDNCFRIGPLTNSIWNTNFRGTSISGKGGTIRLLAAGPVPGSRSGEQTAQGALIKNSYQGEYSTAIVYLMAGDSADTGTLFEMYGGEIIDAITSSHTYDINLQKYTRMDMYGGVISSAYCTYVVYVYDNARFNMRNGEIVRTHTNGGATIYTSSSGAFVMDDGSIHCADNVKPDLTALTNYGYATINGGSIYHFGSDCILTSSKSLTINGGSISDSRYSGIRQDSGTVTVNGGEIFNNSRALVMNGGTATFNKADIYGNTAAGFKVQSGSATLKITSNDVKVHNNPAYEAPIFISSGTLNMTGGLVYENRSPNGGVRVDPSGNATIQNCRFYDNTATSRGGGIWINAGDSKTYTISNVEIDHNTAPSGGGMALHYNQSGSTTYTTTFNVSDVYIHDNQTTTSVGGGLFLEAYTTGTRTMNVNLNRVVIENNTAGNEGTTCAAGGVYMGMGQNTTTANPKTLTVNVDFNGCTIQNNTATGNGGGVFINRAARNDVKVNVTFRNSEADNTETRIVNNTAGGSGGAIFVSNSAPNSNQTIGGKDISVVLNDTTVAQNTAGGSGGAIHANHKSAVYLNNARVTGNTAGENGGALSGKGGGMFYVTQGVYSGNTAAGKGNGFYMADADLKLVNNYAQIAEDNEIYVDDVAHPIVMQSSFTKKSSVYNVYPGDAYAAGSIVVHPGRFYDGYCPDASPYLRNFYSVRPGTVIDRQYPDLIIGRILFLDGENGLDPIFNADGTVAEYRTDDLGVTHTGATPDTAFKTFKACKTALGDAPGGIYVCGTVHYLQENEDELDVWSLGEAQYLRRYCGFKVSTEKTYPAFTGDMISVEQGGLTLTSLTAEGVYKTEEDFTAAGSVFVVNGDDAVLTVTEGAKITENRSSVNGAAVRILKGQMLMTGGEISGNSVTGSAKGAAVWQGDTLTLSGSTLKIEGDVYLAAGATASQETVIDIAAYTYERPVEGGQAGETETVTVSALDFAPAEGSYILVDTENPYDGRDIAVYPEGEIPQNAQKDLFQLAGSLASLYILDNEVTRPNILELKIPNQIYLDGVNGDDDHDGLTPARAVKTLQRAYELIRDFPDSAVSGGLIYVVDTVTVDAAVTLSQTYADSSVTVDAGGPVVFERYAQPSAHASLTGFENTTNLNALFSIVSGGALELAGVTVDGHSYAVASGNAEQISAAVTASAALVDVAQGGSFTLTGGRLQNAAASDEANAGAVNITGGTADITGVITNAGNEAGVSIYDNGSLNLYGSPAISGGVYLAGDAAYVTVPTDFAPANAVSIIPNSAFDGRPIVRYDDSLGEPGLAQKQQWSIPDDILSVYSLNNRAADKQMLELQLKGAVYINGVNGSDSNDGKTPETAVKTLKKAYSLLVDKDGATIYVVDTVTLTASAVLDHGLYLSGADVIDAGDDVQFIRYAQPSDYNAEEPGDLAGFGKPSCTGALLAVPSGVSLAATGVSFDGHSYDVTDSVARYNSSGVKAEDALLRVNVGGTADLSEKVSLQNNANTSASGEGKGGAVANYGTVNLGGVSIANNEAACGSGVYQSGTLNVDGTAHPDVAEDQVIYLTGMQGAADERLITVTGALPAGFTLTVDMEDRVLGRNVAQFEAGAFTSDVTNETDHFAFAFDASQFDLVKSADAAEPDTLELGHIHVWTGPVWTWESHTDANGITVYDTATATFTCSRCGETADVTDEELDVVSTAPKCETAGSNLYTAIVEFEGETYTDSKTVTVPAVGHDWEFKGFTWTGSDETGYTAAAASYECRRDPAHKQTVAAVLTTAGNEPTCEESGTVVYTAAVTAETSLDGTAHDEQKTVTVNALGHDWDTPVWNWTEAVVDGETVFTRVTCTVPCKRDHAHDLVYATDFEGEMHVTLTEVERTPAGCTTDGAVKYVATVDARPELTDSRTVVLPATGHDWDFDHIEWTWTKEIADGEAVWHVTATVTCRNNTEHKWTEIATVTGPEVVTPAGETTPGEQKYTAEVTFIDDTGSHGPYYDYKTEPIPPYGHTHEWTGPVWTWESHTENGITVYDSATAQFTCTGCGDVVNVPDNELDVVTVSAGCEDTGSAEYTAVIEFGGVTYTDSRTVELPALGHDWVFTGFTWTGSDETGWTAAVANYECSHDPAEKRTVDAVVTAETTDPTCLQTGKTVYTAVVTAETSLDGIRHTDEKTVTIPTVDHNWHGPAWTWTEEADGTWDASAKFTCDVTDPAHLEFPPVTVTYEETVHPTADLPGKGVYTAVTVFEGETYTDTKEVDLDPLGHKFVGPEWEWFGSDEEGWEAEATFTCITETGHIEKPPVTMTNEITKQPTCEGTGTRTYTATTVFEGKTYTATKDVKLPPIGHDWGEPVGVWHGKDITVTSTCRNDPSHVLILDADVTEVILEEPWCTTTGLSHLTATVEFRGETYTWEKDYVLPALGHNWGPWVVVREATFEQDGLERRECLRCGLVEERVIPWNGEATREIQFVVSFPMHYVAQLRGGDYYVFSDTTPVIYWYPDQPLTFRVETYTTWSISGYVVSANSHALRPDANGVYTIPAGTERVVINCDPTTAPTESIDELRCPYCGNIHPDTVWGFLIGMVHNLFMIFKNMGR